jgi:hypothetical protein
MFSQEKTTKEMPEYYRKEEILYEGKRYRIHNNYLTAGAGYLTSSMRIAEQRGVGFDLHFHLYKNHHLQIGGMMSGPYFLGNNNTQGHFGYGLRKETVKRHMAAYVGMTYYTGVTEATDTLGNPVPYYFQGSGIYASAQYVTKLTYDIGIGVEVFGELSQRQNIAGFKLMMYFSGAYRGVKRNYNPHVRTEYGK